MSFSKIIIPAALVAALAAIGCSQRAAIQTDLQPRPATPPAALEVITNAPSPGPVAGSPWTLRLPNNAALEMLPVAAGSFTMGSETGDGDEKPVHNVEITKPYWLGKYEVTQAQWAAVMRTSPSYFKGAQFPVEQVSWHDAVEYCAKLTNQERAAGRLPAGYRYTLPTEAQWEYTCRAGTTGNYGGSGNLNEMGWYGDNSGNKTHDVGGKSPNAWGFYDMHGNVWEWCADRKGSYPSGSVTDPTGPNAGSLRVLRGGSWIRSSHYCRSAYRYFDDPGGRYYNLGFRVALAPASVR
jgi:formylglycine-generating enzyme required for sulfatase activity